MADVSVIVPARRDEPFLGEALASILDEGRFVCEVLVCMSDTAGTSGDISRSCGPPLRVIRSAGPAVHQNLNAGLEAATGTWLAFLDADDRWAPSRLAHGLAAFAADPSLAICQGRLVAMTADGVVGSNERPAPLLGTTLLRRSTARQVGSFEAHVRASPMRWLMRADAIGPVRMLDEVLLHRRAHDGNLTRTDSGTLHSSYIAVARDAIRARREGRT